jgi:hypothetical protein
MTQIVSLRSLTVEARVRSRVSPYGIFGEQIGTPNIVVKWLTFVLRILEVLASNLGPETGILTEVFVVFLSPSRKITVYYL